MSDQVQCSCGSTLSWNFDLDDDADRRPGECRCGIVHQATDATRVPEPTDWESPGGYVVVSFTGSAEGWCTLTRCPMGSAPWFPTRALARKYAGTLPDGFQPHILMVSDRV